MKMTSKPVNHETADDYSSSSRGTGFSVFVIAVLSILLFCGLLYWGITSSIEASHKSFPKFSIEAITASNINISSWPDPSFLTAQNLTINFVVENPADCDVEYRNVEASISYKGNIFWLNTLDLHRQQKGDRTSLQVAFGNFPVKLTYDDIEYAITKENRTSGFGIFTVEVKGSYQSAHMNVSCGDVKLQFLNVTNETGLLQKCSTDLYRFDPVYSA